MVRTGLFQRLLIAAVAVACGTSAAPAGIVDAGGEPDPTFAGLRLWLSGGSDVFNDAGVTPGHRRPDRPAVEQPGHGRRRRFQLLARQRGVPAHV